MAIPTKWIDDEGNEAEVEPDGRSDGMQEVLLTLESEDQQTGIVVIGLDSKQAREMAFALNFYADSADRANGVEPLQPSIIGCRREFPERDHERCGKPAKYIVWGKLFAPEALGPRCRECLEDQCGHHAPSSPSHAIYHLGTNQEGAR